MKTLKEHNHFAKSAGILCNKCGSVMYYKKKE